MRKRTKYDKPAGIPTKYRGDRGMGQRGDDFYDEHSGIHKPIAGVGESLLELDRMLKEQENLVDNPVPTPDTSVRE